MDTILRPCSPIIRMQSNPNQKRPNDRTLIGIGMFKLFKGTLFLVLAIVALRLFHHDAYEVLYQNLRYIGIKGESHFAQQAINHFVPLINSWRKLISPLLAAYSLLFFVEGIGLMMQKRWAEYFTIIMTASLVPLELYELVAHPNWLKASALFVNLFILFLLIFHLRRQRHARYRIDAELLKN